LTVQGHIYKNAGFTEQALLAQQRALQDFEQVGDTENKTRALRSLAQVLLQSRQFEQADNYLRQIEALIESAPDALVSRSAVAEIRAYSASLRGQATDALAHYRHALHWATEGNDVVGQHVYRAAIGHELLNLKRPAEALLMADRGLALMVASGTESRDINLLRIKAGALTALGRSDEAHALLLQLVTKAEQRNDKLNVSILWRDLYQLEKSRGRFERAMAYLENQFNADLAVIDENNAQRTAILDATFDSERKTRQITQLQNETRIQQLELDKQRQRLIVAISVGLLLLSATVFYYLRRQHKQDLQREQRLNTKLRELDAVKDQVLANASHELRTPLNGIVGLSELLLVDLADERNRQYVSMIAESGRRLTEVVDGLLESARLKAGRIELNRVPVDVRESLAKAQLICLPLARKKQLHLIDHAMDNLPPVLADPARLQQVLINLLSNAIKFTEDGVIELFAKPVDGGIQIRINDTGIGIPTEYQEKIFDSFVQVDGSMSRRQEGTGLGLAISKKLIELHGGQMGVSSSVGRGSSFWFTLPLATAS